MFIATAGPNLEQWYLAYVLNGPWHVLWPYLEHRWLEHHQAQKILLCWLPGWKWTFNGGPQQHVTTKTTNSQYDMVFSKADNY